MNSKNIKYDEEKGLFVNESELSVNWLLSEVLRKKDLQITKISNEELQTFLSLLDQSNLRMPDGRHSLFWLRDELRAKSKISGGNKSEAWDMIVSRYQFIIERIDMTLANAPDIQEKMKIIKNEAVKKINYTENKMDAHFEPLKAEK